MEEKHHTDDRKRHSRAGEQQRALAPQQVGQVTDRQGDQQGRQVVGGDQAAQQRFVVAQAEHVKVEQQPEDAHGCAGDDHIE